MKLASALCNYFDCSTKWQKSRIPECQLGDDDEKGEKNWVHFLMQTVLAD